MRTFESLHRLVWYRLEVTKICNTEDKKEHKIYYGFFFVLHVFALFHLMLEM